MAVLNSKISGRNDESVAPAQLLDGGEKIIARECNAPGRCRVIRPRDMHENRAPFSLHNRRVIEPDDDNNVISRIVSPQALIDSCIGQAHQPVVIRITRDVAPRIIRIDLLDRQSGAWWTVQPVSAEQHPSQRPSSHRCDAVSFALFHANTTATNGAALRTGAPVRGEDVSVLTDCNV